MFDENTEETPEVEEEVVVETPEEGGDEEVTVETPEEGGEGEEEEEAPKPGDIKYTKKVEKRINRLHAQVKSAERDADYWRGRAEGGSPPPPPKTAPAFSEPEPKEENFETNADYVKALASHQYKADKAVDDAARDTDAKAAAHRSRANTFNENVEKSGILEEHPDFKERLSEGYYNDITEELVMTSEKGPEIAMYFADNPEESQEIGRMDPMRAAKAIARLEVKFTKTPTRKKTTKAPAPISPSGSKGGVAPVDESKLPMAEFAKRRNASKDF